VSNPSPLSVDATAMLPQVAPAPSQGQLLTQERQAERETISAGDFASAVVENDWMASNIRRIEAEQGFADDPAWVVPATKDEKAWEGIPHQDRHKLFDSRSAEHFAWMKDQYAREQATEKELAKAGLWAIPARLALNMGDPLALVASVSTGSGILAKSSRLTNAVRAGLVAGGTNAAIEGVLAKGSQSLDGSDVVLGALAGFAIGAPIGAAIKPRDYDTIQRSLARLSDERRVDLIVEQARAEGVNLNREDVLARMAEQQRDVGGFGGDSVGSARAFTYDPVRDTWVETDTPVAQMAFHQLPTYAGVLRGHKNETVRNGLGLLVDDPIGTVDGSVSHIGATSEKYRIEQVHREQFNTQANLAFEEWLESQNVTMTRAFVTTELPKLRDQFMREVGRAAFGDPDPNISAPAIRLAAQLKSNHFKKLGDELLDTGVIDEALEDYTPVRWQSHLIDQYIEGVDPAHRKFGLEGIEEVFYRGFDNTELAGEIRVSAIARERARVEAAGGVFDDAALELAHKVAEQTVRKFVSGFVRRTREVGRGIEMDAIFGINTKTPQYVRELILDNGGDLQLAEIIEDAITRKVAKFKADDKGKPPVGKHRTDFTRLAGVWLTDQNSPTGEKVFVRVIDLMETNAEHLFNGYIGGASGRIAAARVAGLKTDGDFNLLLDKVRAALPDEKDRLNVIARAEETWKHLTGRPLEDHPGSFYSRAGRVVRNYNMGRVGWTFGLAQIADLGNVVSIGGIRAFLSAMPQLRSLMARGADGRLLNKVSRDLSEIGGIGNAFRAGSLYGSQIDEVIGAEAKLEFYTRASGRVAAKWSGMALINEGMQFVASKLMIDKLAKGKVNAKRLAYLGLTEDEAKAIAKHLDGNVEDLRLGKMNPQLRFKFIHAIRKASLRAVQENDWGATFPFMHTTTGKLLSQFRGFMLVAMSKQSLYMANHRDMESFATFMWSLFFGSLSYLGYVGATKTPEEYEKYLEPKKMAAAAFTRSGWASALPMAIDTPVTFLGFDPLFSYRNSGLPSNAFTGIPAVELANRAQQAVSGTVQSAISGDPFTQRDVENWRRITPVSSMWGVGHAINAAADGLNIPDE
jgi:hypothetical protein